MQHLSLRPALPKAAFITLLLASSIACASVNKSIRVDDGAQSDGHSTVNGSITVGRDAVIDGSLKTVNGTIRVDENTRLHTATTVNGSIRLSAGVSARDIESVNGSIDIGENVTIDGVVSVVNGKIGIERGTSVQDRVSNVNGEIRIEGAEIGGNLETVNGDIWLTDNAHVGGNLVVEKPNSWGIRWKKEKKPRVVIGPGARVTGDIVLEREVELYISETAAVSNIRGVMSLDDAVRFSGARP
ncbi:MAG: hypothetical protein WEA08_08620 [Woeseia sp.]